MPSIPLSEHASVEHLKKQAKLVQELVRSGDDGALDLVAEFHPRIEDPRTERLKRFKRSDAQLVVARLYGFASWPALRIHVEALGEVSRPDIADREPDDEVARFVAHACVSYGDVDALARLDVARAQLVADPGVASASPAAMAATGRHELLAERIAADPAIATRAAEPNAWPLILHCAYSRVEAGSDASAVETLRLLLDAGADPNAGFLWRGLVPPFTALTGVLGGGEQDQPPHPDSLQMARLLLEAGADPNDGQTLYNRGLAGTATDDWQHLELLVAFGLGVDQDGPWYRRFGDRLTAPADLLHDELEVAAHRGLPGRMRYLTSLDLDLNRPVGRSQLRPVELARQGGHTEVLAVLAEAGVEPA